MLAALQKQLDGYRRIIVLLADEEQQSAADRGTSTRVGQLLFHDGLEQRTAIAAQFDTLLRGSSPQRFATSAPCWTTSNLRRNCSMPIAWPSASAA